MQVSGEFMQLVYITIWDIILPLVIILCMERCS